MCFENPEADMAGAGVDAEDAEGRGGGGLHGWESMDPVVRMQGANRTSSLRDPPRMIHEHSRGGGCQACPP